MILPKATSLQWWCIFILYTQRTDSASFFSNAEPTTTGTAGLLSLCAENGESSEQYVSDKGATSSVLLALRPEHGKPSCKRQFRAPDAYNFFVRMQRIPATGSHRSSASRKYNGNKSSNSTHSCPLTISQSANGEVLPSWRLDPCLLETAGGIQEEPMRLLQGKLNIVWNHDGNAANYRLQITVVGQGAVCLEREKHSCLEYVGMPLLCIARELVCDGLPNCPPLGTEVSDENEAMCIKHRQQEYSENPVQSVFRQYIQNTIKSFFGGEPKELPSKPPFGEVDIALEQKFGSVYSPPALPPPTMASPTTESAPPPKKHRSSMTGLSKYGPWGYLFLGMLICGSALLICGLWECCCRTHKPEPNPDDSLPDPVPSFLQTSSPGPGMGSGGSTPSHNLPQYGELDPPPAYSVLFPTQKPSDNSDNASPVVPATMTTSSPSISSNNNTTTTGDDGHSQVQAVVASDEPPSVSSTTLP